MMKVSIKNMVCNPCIMVVERTFQEAGVKFEGTIEKFSELCKSYNE